MKLYKLRKILNRKTRSLAVVVEIADRTFRQFKHLCCTTRVRTVQLQAVVWNGHGGQQAEKGYSRDVLHGS